MIKTLGSLLVLLSLLAMGLPLSAQEGLPTDERALLEKAAAAVKATDSYTSFAEDTVTKDSQDLTLKNGDEIFQQIVTSQRTDGHAIYVRGDSPAFLYNATIEGEENGIGYTAEGELRYLDETLYASASYTPADPAEAALYVFPDGFTVLADPADPGAFAMFDPQALIDTLNSQSAGYFDDLDRLSQAVQSVTSQEGEFNGTPVEIITIDIPSDNLFFLMASNSADFDPTDPTMRLLFSYLTDDSYGIVAIYLDEEGNLLQQQIEVVFNVEGADAGQIEASLEGLTVSLKSTTTLSFANSQINQVKDEITAPELSG